MYSSFKVFKNSLSSYISKGLTLIIFFWVQRLLLLKISVEEYSLYVIISSFIFLLPVLSSSIQSAAAKYMIEAYAKNQENEMNLIYSNAILSSYTISGIVIITGFFSAQLIVDAMNVSQDLRNLAHEMTIILILNFAVSFIGNSMAIGIHLRQALVLNNTLDIISEIFRVFLLYFLMNKFGYSAIWVIHAMFFTNIVLMSVKIMFAKKLMPKLSFKINLVSILTIKKILSFGTYNSLIIFNRYLRNFGLIILYQRIGNANDVRALNIGRFISKTSLQLWEPVRASIGAKLIADHSLAFIESLRKTFVYTTRFGIFLIGLVIGYIYLYAQGITDWLLKEVADESIVVLVRLSCLNVFFQSSSLMLPQLSQAYDDQKNYVKRALSSVLLSILFVTFGSVTFNFGVTDSALLFLLSTLIFDLIFLMNYGFKLLELWKLSHIVFLYSAFIPFIIVAVSHQLHFTDLFLSENISILSGIIFVIYYGVILHLVLSREERLIYKTLTNKLFNGVQ